MKKYSILFLITLITISILLLLSGCSEAANSASELTNMSSDANTAEGIGGDYRECYHHSAFFCSGAAFDYFVTRDIISTEDLTAWGLPLRKMRASPHDECLVNVVTFIEYFDIPREVFQQTIDYYQLDFSTELNLDVLYSGDVALIEQYYSIENEELHRQMILEREVSYVIERIKAYQEIVNEHVSSQYSRYYHDIWTFAKFYPDMARTAIYRWMKPLIDAGEYENINIFQLIRDLEISEEYFTRQVLNYDMEFLTHYNIEILFSDDQRLIEEYYSIENESYHTKQVRTASDFAVIVKNTDVADIDKETDIVDHEAGADGIGNDDPE